MQLTTEQAEKFKAAAEAMAAFAEALKEPEKAPGPTSPTIERVYGCPRSALVAPDGYELGEFRALEIGDYFLSSNLQMPEPNSGAFSGCFRIIPRPKRLPLEPGRRLQVRQ